jgi:hypothetical protein
VGRLRATRRSRARVRVGAGSRSAARVLGGHVGHVGPDQVDRSLNATVPWQPSLIILNSYQPRCLQGSTRASPLGQWAAAVSDQQPLLAPAAHWAVPASQW